jgi:hypothetical protein
MFWSTKKGITGDLIRDGGIRILESWRSSECQFLKWNTGDCGAVEKHGICGLRLFRPEKSEGFPALWNPKDSRDFVLEISKRFLRGLSSRNFFEISEGYARNDRETLFLSLRGAQRRSNLNFFNSPSATFLIPGGLAAMEFVLMPIDFASIASHDLGETPSVLFCAAQRTPFVGRSEAEQNSRGADFDYVHDSA